MKVFIGISVQKMHEMREMYTMHDIFVSSVMSEWRHNMKRGWGDIDLFWLLKFITQDLVVHSSF